MTTPGGGDMDERDEAADGTEGDGAEPARASAEDDAGMPTDAAEEAAGHEPEAAQAETNDAEDRADTETRPAEPDATGEVADADADEQIDGRTAADGETEGDAGAETDIDTVVEAEGETEPDADTETDAEVDADVEPDADTDVDEDAEPDTEADAETDADTEANEDAEPDADADADEQPVGQDTEERPTRAQRRGAHARRVTPRERLRELVAPQANRTQALIALACLLVGFGLSVQVTSTSQESSFSSLRQSELVGLLDRLNKRQEDLRKEVLQLQEQKSDLQNKDSGAARKAAEERRRSLGILAGTEPATGPGIELVITDPDNGVNASDLLNAVQELRDAGAEVLQIGSVRVAVDTYFLDAKKGIEVDGKSLTAPYRIKAIGDPHTMATAMGIPGGVLESLHRAGADGSVTESQSIAITAVRDKP